MDFTCKTPLYAIKMLHTITNTLGNYGKDDSNSTSVTGDFIAGRSDLNLMNSRGRHVYFQLEGINAITASQGIFLKSCVYFLHGKRTW